MKRWSMTFTDAMDHSHAAHYDSIHSLHAAFALIAANLIKGGHSFGYASGPERIVLQQSSHISWVAVPLVSQL